MATAATGVLVAGVAVRRSHRHAAHVVALMCVAAALVGSGLAAADTARVEDAQLACHAATRAFVEVAGRAVSDARPTLGGAWQLFDVRRVDDAAARERVVLRWPQGAQALTFGERARLDGALRPLNRDGFGGYLRQMHAVAELRVAEVVERGDAPWLLRAVEGVRQRTLQVYRAGLSAEYAALLAGLTVGEQPPNTLAEPFDAAGLTHLLVVSGQHMVIAAGVLLSLGTLLRFGFRTRRVLALSGVWLLAILVRPQPSVLRAAFAVSVVLFAQMRGRPDVALHTLAAVVIALLLIDPLLAGQTGFLLSVTATAGLLLFVRHIGGQMPGPQKARLLVAAAVAAQLAVTPVLLWRIGAVPLLAVPANVLAMPLAGAAQTVGVASSVVGQVQPQLGARITRLAVPPLWSLAAVARGFADGPTLQMQPTFFSPMWRLLPGRLPTRVYELALTALDVGQGDAILIDAPMPAGSARGVARMLVDGGADPDTALRLLARMGVAQLDAVVMSHGDLDHSGGLAQVISKLRPGALIVGPHPPLDVGSAGWQVLQAARATGVPVVRVHAGQRFTLGTASVEVLSPPVGGFPDAPSNEHSLILRVHGPGGRILLTGDSEVLAQDALLARPDKLRAEVLKVPHHGGNTNADGFLAAVGARIAVISVGSDNTYGHPHPDVLAALHGSQIRRTDHEGTLRITLDEFRVATIAAGGFKSRSHPARSSRAFCEINVSKSG